MATEEKPKKKTVADQEESALVRPVTLVSATTTSVPVNFRHYNMDDISITPSPLESRPLVFQPGSVIDPNVYERVYASVYDQEKKELKKKNEKDEEEDDDDDDDEEENNQNQEYFNEDVLTQARDNEVQRLSHVIVTGRPIDDDVAAAILERLNFALDAVSTPTITETEENPGQESTSTTISTHPYPPIHQVGIVSDHDRPYADYGHLDARTIAEELNFYSIIQASKREDPQQPPPPPPPPVKRMCGKSFAITCWTTVSKETVMAEIKRLYRIEQLRYVCVAHEIGDQDGKHHLHIQIILKQKGNRKTWFLDDITGTHCHYEVTNNDRAWNEYIKKGGNFIEFGSFKTTTVHNQKKWPTQTSSLPTTNRVATTVRAQTEEKRGERAAIARHAIQLARTSVDSAMDYIMEMRPEELLAHTTWYLSSCNYIHLRAQQELDRTGILDKEYIWPDSFPDCTPALREAMNYWLENQFVRKKGAKCLILIGPTSVGKTAFALSLPGRVNYFLGRWHLDEWSDYARYSVYDEIPWDDFEKLNFPNKRCLLLQKGKLKAADKYRPTTTINVTQPAIVLLNDDTDVGSLAVIPTTIPTINLTNYWKKRAFIYRMGPDEYFCKPPNRRQADGHDPSSGYSIIGSQEERIGQPDEFEQMTRHWHEKHAGN